MKMKYKLKKVKVTSLKNMRELSEQEKNTYEGYDYVGYVPFKGSSYPLLGQFITSKVYKELSA